MTPFTAYRFTLGVLRNSRDSVAGARWFLSPSGALLAEDGPISSA